MSVCNVLLYYARPFSGFTTLPFFLLLLFPASFPPFISSTFFLFFYVCPFVSSARCIILAKRSRQKAKQGHKNKNSSTFLWGGGGGSTVQPLKKKKEERKQKRAKWWLKSFRSKSRSRVWNRSSSRLDVHFQRGWLNHFAACLCFDRRRVSAFCIKKTAPPRFSAGVFRLACCIGNTQQRRDRVACLINPSDIKAISIAKRQTTRFCYFT